MRLPHCDSPTTTNKKGDPKAASLFSFLCGLLWLGVYNLVLDEIG